ncbi:hypothetical protein FPZ42_16985 [Mucilaginibacter achroorhodeus]|uniref:Pentapeptide MXKDX repeat protein n=1 Tax=Mucilaginibacter achroorhodeus TaxID=2599294 RepID=A0A563TY50_9SPHI|nr:hypothetical protein [Mucilaginibacter achroorhodeus]TWR24183.1 hypothetical protein FPZ42_16985 [Mucilaginibacter achroorhodeus]
MKSYKSLIAGLSLAFICIATVDVNAATNHTFFQDKMSKMKKDTSKMDKMGKDKMKMDKKKMKMKKDTSKMGKM